MIQVQEINMNLYDFFETIKKHWKIVLSVVVISTIVSMGTMGIKIFSTSKLYEIAMFIDPGAISVVNGKVVLIDSAKEIDERIKNKVYKWSINEDPVKPFIGVDLNFNVSSPKQTNLVKITSVQKKNDVKKGIKLMNDLFGKLVDDNREKIKAKKMKLRAKASDIDVTILAKKNIIELQEEKLKTLTQKEERLLGAMVLIENNLKELNLINEELKGIETEAYVKLSGSEAVICNIDRLQDLQNRYDSVLSEKEKLKLANNKQIEEEIRNLNYQKDDIRIEEANIRNITTYDKLKVERIISDQKLWVYPIGGAIMGLVIGSFLACIIELRKKYEGKV